MIAGLLHPRFRRVPAVQIALLAAFTVFSTARAEITPAAREVVERYIAATGGRAALEAVHSTHMKITLEAFGLTGRTDVWLATPDRRASEVALGPFKLRDGFDGARAWRTDPSGKVIVLDGKDLEDAKSSAWFENDRWLAPDQGGGRVALAGEERDSSGSWTVLEVTPPAGRARRVYLDPRTGLIGRVVVKNDQMTISTALSDYREVAGRRIAFRTLQQMAGMPANDVTLTLDSIWVNEEVPASRFAEPGGAAVAVKYLKTPGLARLPFEYSAKHVWLRASVNGGPPADFLYDTGASASVLDSAYAASIGVRSEGRIQGQGAGATGNASFAQIATLRVAAPDGDGIEIGDVKVAVLDLNGILEPFFWRPAAGIVGFDFIVRFVNEIDYDRRTITLRDPATFTYGGKGTAVPMTLAGHVPAVKFTLDGRIEGDYRIDVGSGSTVDLHGPFVKKHGLAARVGSTVEISGGGFGGTFQSRAGRMASMSVGPYSWARPLVVLSGAQTGALASEDYAGNVGNRILERFKCTIDYERRVLYLEPGARYEKPDSFTHSGMQLAKIGGAIRAARVMPRSPASEAGVREGDVVASIAGRPAADYSVDEVEGLLERGPVGSRVKLELLQAGRKRTVTLKLREVL
jgi:hypothetical protein